jgi:hypothetical protein
MPDRMQSLAWFSVARGCGFAMLGIGTTMVGLSNEPALSLRTGGMLALMTAMVLLLKAQRAASTPHKTTELWLLLAPDERPREAIAQQVIAVARREAMRSFALYFSLGAALLLAVGLLLSAFG